MTHISAIPLELIMYIFKWVVSTELDVKSLERLGRVQRNCFYLKCTFKTVKLATFNEQKELKLNDKNNNLLIATVKFYIFS